jgi:enamine deaminase RidA (YjgF/YER057c/UK114 family)
MFVRISKIHIQTPCLQLTSRLSDKSPEGRMLKFRSLTTIGFVACFIALAGCANTGGTARNIVRHKIPSSSFPIANAIELPPGATTVYLSGKVPPLVDKSKSPSDAAAYGGDTEGQTVETLKSIDSQLRSMGLGLSDVVKMQVYLVGDPSNGGKMDFAGFMKGYSRFFGTPEQPLLPVRSAFQVAGLANPAWYVEIEVVAARGLQSVVK